MSKIFTATEMIDAQVGIDDRQALGASSPGAKARPPKMSRRRRQTSSPSSSSAKKHSKPARSGTKQDLAIQLLRRQSGVSIDEIAAKTGWQPHSVRGFLSGVVRKKLKFPLVSDLGKDCVRRYHIAPITVPKA